MPQRRTPMAVSDERLAQILAQSGHGRDMLCDDSPRIRRTGGGSQLSFRLRLPSYRALPLCCIESLQVSVDGASLQARDAQLVLDGVPFRIGELGTLAASTRCETLEALLEVARREAEIQAARQ